MRIVVCAAVMLLALTASNLGRAEGKRKVAACKVDADCALVPAQCCDCSHGGEQKAIPAREKSKYERERRARCADTLCAAVVSQDPSCSATAAVCKEGQCSLPQTP